MNLFDLKRVFGANVIVKLKGGLGNQMFQYAVARGTRNGNRGVIVDDKFIRDNYIHSEKFTGRDYELHIFRKLKMNLANGFLTKVLYDSRLPYRVLRKLFYLKVKIIAQKENEFVAAVNYTKEPLYLDGFFQSEKYFKHIRNELLQEFSFPELDEVNLETLAKIKSFANPVSIHIRRGDYLKPQVLEYHGILPISYYEKSIKLVEDSFKDLHYFIFSDDPEWCKDKLHFLNGRYTLIKNNRSSDSWKDMYLMTKCKHHIIANSSFSWWGAWLSTFEDGLTLAPYKWFNPSVVSFDINDFVPVSWKVVTYE